MIKEGYTYINIIPSPLHVVMMEGSPSKVSRGWGQELNLSPQDFSFDPDDPDDTVSFGNWKALILLDS